MSEVKLYDPAQLSKDEWRQLQTLQREADSSTLDRSREDIDTLVGWHEPERFYSSHVDPNSEVGKRYNSNQAYSHPKVAIATEHNEPIGFAYRAHNVSGATDRDRLLKRLSVVKNYLWIREIAVKPDHQRQGVAKDISRALLKDAIILQPVAAYIWPDEINFLSGVLERLGFSPTGEQNVKLLGEDRPAIRQVRMQAPTVRSVLKHLG